jgi:hypothetical protein
LDKKKKEVDRKASKNRKIRYVVHDKLVNFMTPLENLALSEGKENILTTLFGQHKPQEATVKQDGETKKRNKLTGSKRKRNYDNDEEDAIRLI